MALFSLANTVKLHLSWANMVNEYPWLRKLLLDQKNNVKKRY